MSVYKDDKHGTWYCQFRYVDWQGNRQRTTKRGFKTKREAKEYEADFIKQATSNPDMTLKMLADKYLEHYKQHRKESSYCRISGLVKNHILSYLADISVSDISPNRIREWQNAIGKLNLSPSSTRSINGVFISLLNFAVKYFNLPTNPFKVTGSTGKKEKRLDLIEADEFNLLVQAIGNEPFKLAIKLLFYSGMRIGELFALSETDFDYEADTISISKNWQEAIRKIGTPKTEASIRVVTMPHTLMMEVQEYIESFRVVPEQPFRLSSRPIFQKHLDNYAAAAGIKRILIHTLRHSHASYLIQSGVPITAISKRLGHTSPDITLKVYSHVYKENDQQIATMLEKSLNAGLL